MMKKSNKILKNNKGITGIDLTIGLIVLALFSGVITMLMSYTYKSSLEIQKGANAMAYATMVLEKVDEKSYEEVNDAFVTYLENLGEIELSNQYVINFSAKELSKDLFKKVEITVNYDFFGEQKSLAINKLKIKELEE